MDAIRDRQWGASSDGRTLVVPLLQMMQDYIPGVAFDGLPVAVIRHLAGEQCADLLGLPQADWTRVLLDAALELGAVLEGLDRGQRHYKLLSYVTHKLMQGIVLAEREGKQARFRIPTSLDKTVDPDF